MGTLSVFRFKSATWLFFAVRVSLLRKFQVMEPQTLRLFWWALGIYSLWEVEDLRERPFHYLGGAGRVVFSRLFFHLMFKAGFFFHTPVEARFFFHKELKVRLFFYSHVSSQRYSHYFQGWGKIIFFATYQSKQIFSTYRLGQIIFFWPKAAPDYFFKNSSSPPPDNEMVAPLGCVWNLI